VADRRRPYDDRAAAGRELAGRLSAYAGRQDVLVLGLVRGGVPVAAEVAAGLGAPLEPLVVRKIGAPGRPELAMGALTAVGHQFVVVRNDEVIDGFAISEDDFATGCAREQARLREAESRYASSRRAPQLEGAVAVVVDDGLATGASMRAAVAAVKQLAAEVDEVVCPWQPEWFGSVGAGYVDFGQVDDATVLALLSS